MNLRITAYLLGKLAVACAMALCIPLAVAVLYNEENISAFLWAIAWSAGTGVLLVIGGHRVKDTLTVREGIAVTTLGWVLISFLGMIPYAAGGYLSVLDGIVETISGFSGTGATVIDDIEALPQSLILWRSLTHWFGGLGIIVIFIALFPRFCRGAVRMFNAESTGPTDSRFLPQVKEMAKALFTVYVVFTIICTLVLYACGLDLLIAADHAFSTIATGGFSPYNNSVAHFDSPLIEGVLAFFMIISSANFGMYVAAWRKGIECIFKDTEFRIYCLVVLVTTMLMAGNLILTQGWTYGYALREAFFQSVSISSSTGFVSYDFDTWPTFSKYILIFLMFLGGCAGSTAGGLKVTRLMLLFKTARALLRQKIYPREVIAVSSNGSEYSEEVLFRVVRFFFVYVMLDLLWTVLLVWDGVPVFEALGVSISTMGSCGPSFGLFGATCTYSALPPFSKVVVSISMLMGRLESFSVLVLFLPSFWHRRQGW